MSFSWSPTVFPATSGPPPRVRHILDEHDGRGRLNEERGLAHAPLGRAAMCHLTEGDVAA